MKGVAPPYPLELRPTLYRRRRNALATYGIRLGASSNVRWLRLLLVQPDRPLRRGADATWGCSERAHVHGDPRPVVLVARECGNQQVPSSPRGSRERRLEDGPRLPWLPACAPHSVGGEARSIPGGCLDRGHPGGRSPDVCASDFAGGSRGRRVPAGAGFRHPTASPTASTQRAASVGGPKWSIRLNLQKCARQESNLWPLAETRSPKTVKTDASRAGFSLWCARFDRLPRQSPRQEHSGWDSRNGPEGPPEFGAEPRLRGGDDRLVRGRHFGREPSPAVWRSPTPPAPRPPGAAGRGPGW